MIDSKHKGTRIATTVAGAAIASAIVMLSAAALSYGAEDPAAGVQTLSLAELESHLQAQGIQVREMEVEGLLLEVEGFDAEGQKIDLVLDRRSGEVLSRKVDRRRHNKRR